MHVGSQTGVVWRKVTLATVALALFLCLVTVIVMSYLPVITHAEAEEPSGGWRIISMPYIQYHPARLESRVRFTLYVPGVPPDDFQLSYRDDVTSFLVNGNTIVVSGSSLRLGAYLRRGDNHLQAVVAVREDPSVVVFGFGPSVWQAPMVIGTALTLLTFIAWLWFVSTCGRLAWPRSVFGVAVLGAALRVFYAASTPVSVRAYDWRGHLEYVSYLTDRLAFPHAGELWQGHQPPLFYLLCTPFQVLGRLLGWADAETAILLKIVPLLLSMATLVIGLRIILRSFSTLSSRIVGALIISAFPALIYFSSQVNNDVLLTFFGFVWFERLLCVSGGGTARQWAFIGLLCGLGLLTKANALPWVVVSGCMILLTGDRWSVRFRHGVVLGTAAFVGGGWWYLVQLLFTRHYAVVANAFSQIGLVTLTPSLPEFVTFNPVQLILHPSVSVSDYATRPQYLLETLFRSSQLGSVYFADSVNILIVFALLLLAWAVIGAFVELKGRSIIHVVTIAVLILASALFRLCYPFPTSEHFRYVAVMSAPLAVLAARGIAATRIETLRILGETAAAMYAVFVTIIVLSVLLLS